MRTHYVCARSIHTVVQNLKTDRSLKSVCRREGICCFVRIVYSLPYHRWDWFHPAGEHRFAGGAFKGNPNSPSRHRGDCVQNTGKHRASLGRSARSVSHPPFIMSGRSDAIDADGRMAFIRYTPGGGRHTDSGPWGGPRGLCSKYQTITSPAMHGL